MEQMPLGVRLRDRAVFDSFLPGPNAQLVAHLRAVAAGDRPGVTWIHGAPGTGRTHLLQAVCALAGTRERAGYFPLAALAPLGAGALEGVAALDCVCIDDLQQVIGRRDWERALFNLYREMDETSRRLIVAADAPPVGRPWALPDLGSRFGASAIFGLQELNEDEQAEALRRHAQARGLELPDDTVRFLQRRFPRATARLCEILDTLDDASLSAQRRITVPFIREVLSD